MSVRRTVPLFATAALFVAGPLAAQVNAANLTVGSGARASALLEDSVVGPTGSKGEKRTGEVVVAWTVIDDGAATRDAGVPAGEPVSRSKNPCGTNRPCVAKADLRVTSVAAPRWIAATVPFAIMYEVENRGQTAAKPVEVAVCRRAPSAHGPCPEQPSDVFTLPALEPGETATVRRMVTLNEPAPTESFTIVVDPDRLASEANYVNNLRKSATASAESPKIEVLTSATLPGKLTAADARKPLVFTYRVRNSARATATGELELAFTTEGRQGSGCKGMPPALPIVVPSLPARAVVDLTVTLPPIFAGCSGWNYLGLAIEPKAGRIPGSDFEALRVGPHGLEVGEWQR